MTLYLGPLIIMRLKRITYTDNYVIFSCYLYIRCKLKPSDPSLSETSSESLLFGTMGSNFGKYGLTNMGGDVKSGKLVLVLNH